MAYFRATDTIHSSVSPIPVRKGEVLPDTNPVVKAHPEFFVAIEEAAARTDRAWETAEATPEVRRKPGRPRKAPVED